MDDARNTARMEHDPDHAGIVPAGHQQGRHGRPRGYIPCPCFFMVFRFTGHDHMVLCADRDGRQENPGHIHRTMIVAGHMERGL
ncbi:hypothetical protein CFR78_12450 [Komagataeibacter rhaeticus]|nr:hypothetical protein GLUCORHAEAF1_12255 [Komagataeibacter rhaeticus AF1]PYD52885.1 hypothetical protein CFR78_12450 [Komagataeibacter rhaeticus]